MDSFEINIYNLYLKVLGLKNNRPYKFRKHFVSLTDEKKYNTIKLANFFKKYDHIDIETFLLAPYELWEDTKFHSLEFYTKRKALNCYIKYKKKLLMDCPDSKHHLNDIVNSFIFIREFCNKNKINPINYITYDEPNYSFLEHLKYGKVSIYSLFGYDNFKSIFRDSVDSELKSMLFGDMYMDYDILYRRFNNSKKSHELAKKCLIKIQS